MELIYYYPFGNGAPSEISRNLFSSLVNKKMPFDLKVFTQNNDGSLINKMNEKYSNIDFINLKQLCNISSDSITHISISPLIFPNRKFLLHLVSIFKHNNIVLNYQGDPRTELYFKLIKLHDIRYVGYIPDYFLSPYLMKNAKMIVVNSNFMQNFMNPKYNLKNTVVIPNAINNKWLENAKAIELDGDPSIFYHGRLAPEKGVDILIKAFSKVVLSNPSVKLYIAGSGPIEQHLKSLVLKCNLKNNVEFVGMLSQCEIKSYLSSADAAIYPSIYEPFSLAVLEAFSSAKGPVFYSSHAGIDDFVKLEGYSFNSFKPTIEKIQSIFDEIIEKSMDYSKLVKQQKKFAAKYTWEKVADKYIELYVNIFDSRV